MTYQFTKAIDLAFDALVERVTGELKKEGFVVLIEINVERL